MNGIGNILLKSTCIIGGLCLIKNSGHIKKENFAHPLFQRVMQCAIAAIGTAAIAYGAYQLKSSLFQFQESIKMPLLPKDSFFVPCQASDQWPSAEEKIIESLQSCSATNDLLERVASILKEDGKTLSIKLVEPNAASFGALSNLETGEISVSCALRNLVPTSVFELLNQESRQEALDIAKAAKRGLLCHPDVLAKHMEKIEFENVLKHIKIMDTCIKEKGWDASFNEFVNYTQNWEDYWHHNRYSAHANHYRTMFQGFLNEFTENVKWGFVSYSRMLDHYSACDPRTLTNNPYMKILTSEEFNHIKQSIH